MAVTHAGLILSFIAEEDLSDYQYRYVALSTTEDYVKAVDSTSEDTIGIIQNAPESGEVANVMIDGVSKLVAAEALSAGDIVDAEYISSSDSGKGIVYEDGGERKGIVLRGASAEDKYATVLLKNT